MRPIGRYLLFGEIAAGGMATVHLGRLSGPAGFARTVAIKQLHPQFAKDPDFVTMFLDEARLAGRIRHPNVVPTLDVVVQEHEIFLVMEYVQGASLSKLLRLARGIGQNPDPRIIVTIVAGMLHGLHAAHEARGEMDEPLDIVHRDVSPQNLLVGIDGVPRVLDFGVAKAVGRLQTTREGQVKGKFAYMAPEQLSGQPVNRQADIYAAAVVLWESLTAERLFRGEHEAAIVTAVLRALVPLPSEIAPHLPPELDRIVMRGLDRNPAVRYETAREMAFELEQCMGVASAAEVGAWVEALASEELRERSLQIKEMESVSAQTRRTPTPGIPPVPVSVPIPVSVVTRVSWPPGDATVRDLGVETRSDISSMAVAPMNTVPPRSPRSRVAFWGGVLVGPVLLLFALLGLMLVRDRLPGVRGAASEPQAPEPAVVAQASSSLPVPAPSGSVLSISASDLPVAAIAATDLPTAPRPDPTTGPSWRRHRPPPLTQSGPTPVVTTAAAPSPSPPAAAPTPKPASTIDCDPPFWIDSDGHKRYKPACI